MSALFEKKRTGEIIKSKRLGARLTQAEFAKKMNVTVSAVSKWETGRGMPDIALLYAIAREFNTTIDYLLGGELPPSAESAIQAYKKRFIKKLLTVAAAIVLIAALITASTIGIYSNRETIFWDGSSSRNCYNFAKEYLAAYNGEPRDFPKYLGLSDENIDVFLMSEFNKRKENNGKLSNLWFSSKKDDYDKAYIDGAGFSYVSGLSLGRQIFAEECTKNGKSWRYKYNFPKVTASNGDFAKSIMDRDSKTINLPVTYRGIVSRMDLAVFGIDYDCLIHYDNGTINGADIFPKEFKKTFAADNDRAYNHYELFALLTVDGENIWFKIVGWNRILDDY